MGFNLLDPSRKSDPGSDTLDCGSGLYYIVIDYARLYYLILYHTMLIRLY